MSKVSESINSTQIVISSEETAFIVPYDIPSENFLQFQINHYDDVRAKELKAKIKDYVRASRVKATYYLHGLGILCTNSVVLVPKSKANDIDRVISKVEEIYKEVNERLKKEGFNEIGKPIIKKIPITQNQLVQLRELAERKLLEQLEEKINSVAKLINEIEEIVEKDRKERIKKNLSELKRENENIERIAKELGINVNAKISVLGALISKALNSLGGI
jgi:cobalamin biosynthesis Mg chelatase CobN